MDRVVCSQEDGSGSGSGSGGWICKGSTPDLTVINKAFVHPAPSITLPQVSTPPHKRHTLLSPLPSRPGTPSPLRHITTPTTTLTPAIATAHLPPDSLLFDTAMPIHQPRPQHATLSPTISPSDSQSQHRPVTPSRPSSRSEKLLRDTLLRDQERPPMPTSPYATATVSPSAGRSPNPRHKRRHSELPPMNGRTRSQEEERQEELARGAMMFRTPMMMAASPRSPSPFAAHDSPNLTRRHSQTQHHPHHHHGAASQHSHSPTRSPVLARRSSIKSQQSSSQQQQQPRHASPGISRQRVPHPLPLGPESLYHQAGEPVMRTPHEQVLRARLERVLQSGSKPAAGPKHDVYYEEWRRGDSSPPADDEQESSESSESLDEDENVVRDENGTRAWRRDLHAPLPPTSSPRKHVGGKASPPSSSESARSDSQERRQLQQRSRSSTVPDFPAMQQQQHPGSPYPPHPTPRRSTTAPNAAALKRQPQPHHHHHHHRGRHAPSGTTPPLVSDGSPTPPEDDEDRESDEMRLLTPPSTPPSHLATYNHQALVAAYGGAYAPSPYYTKTAFSVAEQRSKTLQGRGRPPLRGLGPALYDEDDEEDDDDEDDSASGSSSFYEEGEGYYCSSGSCSSCSGSGCSSCVRYIHKQLPTNPMQHHALPHRHHQQQLQRQQQFNVRRASARCREMEGYVSFSAVEGLGAPPESESGEEAENAQKGAAAKKGGVGGWVRRLLGSEGANGAVVV